ncbi:efflux RND transporter periplasmic adaptor subunit [Tichowtungia aerotolerans]|uniref:Efflux RND transporter periplasmic adaptor subunit n=1 Tax=Tichowtungia aerotolerans TaxID=2697043 RepID=A0A6P1M9R3_9BACT|nr:efflux RND transporter periplasmic adaptor subunit [Tichowtungia aerotolerans]QHI68316.1 efflux RND transporter periplasmic adaptor subunit [Tichowtungia aerotolerans]
MKKRGRFAAGLAGGAVLVLLSTAALRSRGVQGEEPEPVIRPVPTCAARALSSDSVRRFPGTVRANRRVELAFSVSGLLEQLNAGEGRSIRKGETIARLDQRDFRYALDRAQATLANARQEWERYTRLREQKVATDAEYESAQAAYDIALAEFQIRQKALEDTVLCAPFDGMIVQRHVENHEHVQAKHPIVSFQDISLVEVLFQVPERLIAQGGTEVFKSLQVCFDADSGRWFPAEVREHSAKSNRITQTYDVVLVLAPPADLRVLPGMTATVRAGIATAPAALQFAHNATRIPVEALCRGGSGKSYVWVIDPAGGTPRKVFVESADFCGDCVDVRSALRPGEQVAVAGLHALREDIPVRPLAAGKEGLDG